MSNIPFDKILGEIYTQIKQTPNEGNVASYIPELATIPRDKFGMAVVTNDDEVFFIGDSLEKFSIQSISKVLSLAYANSLIGPELWKRVGIEPSGNPFNSFMQLEYEKGIPRNPFINAGALVVADVLLSHLKNPEEDFIQFIRAISKNNSIDYNLHVAKSEHAVGYRNAALVNILKQYNNLNNDVHRVLEFYFKFCSIEMTCVELAQTFTAFSKRDQAFKYGKVTLTTSQVKRINAIMQTCGFYDEAGNFAYLVGLPGKSGVGGGIAAIQPNHYSVAVWSPPLNKKGNSYLGMKALEWLTDKTELSIF